MDDIVYYFYHNGLYILMGLAAVKVLIILIYKGVDIAYLFENFLIIYISHGIEPNIQRKRFRNLHNVVTFIFYGVLIIWAAIIGVVHLAR